MNLSVIYLATERGGLDVTYLLGENRHLHVEHVVSVAARKMSLRNTHRYSTAMKRKSNKSRYVFLCSQPQRLDCLDLRAISVDDLDTLLLEQRARLRPRLRASDAARALLDDVGREAQLRSVERRVDDAEVAREPDDEHVRDLRGAEALLEVAHRARERGVAQRRAEGGVHLDAGVGALEDDGVDARVVELGEELVPRGADDAVRGPELRLVRLRGVRGVHDRGGGDEGGGAGVVGREGDVVGRVVVFSGDLEDEGELQEVVEDGDNVASSWDSERSILYGTYGVINVCVELCRMDYSLPGDRNPLEHRRG